MTNLLAADLKPSFDIGILLWCLGVFMCILASLCGIQIPLLYKVIPPFFGAKLWNGLDNPNDYLYHCLKTQIKAKKSLYNMQDVQSAAAHVV